MKNTALRVLSIAFGLIAFAAGGGQHDGLNFVLQQIKLIGPWQWLGLMAGAIIIGVPVVAPLVERLAQSRARRIAFASETGGAGVAA